MMGTFECEVELNIFACGRVSLHFGPMEPGDVSTLLEYLGRAESFRDTILDKCAQHLTTLTLRDLDSE